MAGKIVIVLSDLHLGAGAYDDGNRLEDFTSDALFVELLKTIARESESSGRAVDLMMNGDLGEFLQVPARTTFDAHQNYGPDDYRDMSAAASVRKLRHLMVGHPTVFTMLRDWLRAESPQRRLIITKGNHDPQWHWPEVQNFMRQALGAADGRASLLEFPPVGYAHNRLYVEHGNQYTESANRFTNFAAPLARNNPSQLEIPWGSKFVIEFFNTVEHDRYWVDGIKPYSALVWFALKYDPAFAFRTIVALLRAAPKLTGVQDTMMDSWLTNLATYPQQAAERFRTDAEYRKEFTATLAYMLQAVDPNVKVRDDVAGDEDLRQLALDLYQAQDRGLQQAAERLATEHQASIVLFGHTHRPVNEVLPSGVQYINTGTWTWLIDFTSVTDEQWQDLFAQPDKYAARRRLNYARIDYDDAGNPSGYLLEFQPKSTLPELPVKKPGLLGRIIAFIKRLFERWFVGLLVCWFVESFNQLTN